MQLEGPLISKHMKALTNTPQTLKIGASIPNKTGMSRWHVKKGSDGVGGGGGGGGTHRGRRAICHW